MTDQILKQSIDFTYKQLKKHDRYGKLKINTEDALEKIKNVSLYYTLQVNRELDAREYGKNVSFEALPYVRAFMHCRIFDIDKNESLKFGTEYLCWYFFTSCIRTNFSTSLHPLLFEELEIDFVNFLKAKEFVVHEISFHYLMQIDNIYRLIHKNNIALLTERLYNRVAMEKLFYKTVEKSFENEKPYSIILLDIDYFKQINDSNDYDFGDKCLVKVADILADVVNEKGFAGRWGGEEFMLLIPNADEKDTVRIAEEIKEKLKDEAIERNLKDEDREKFPSISDYVTVSQGIVTSKGGEIDGLLNTLSKEADNLLKEVKQAGRNNYKHKLVK